MAYVRKRGKKYTAYWIGENGERKSRAAFADKGASQRLANDMESRALRVREGLDEPGEAARREAAAKPLAVHVDDYQANLLAKGDSPRHVAHIAGAIRRLITDAGIVAVSEIAPDRVQQALGRIKAQRSARTANHALSAVKSFARWLANANRIREVPRGLLAIRSYSEKLDRKRVRRALTPDEVSRLLAAAEGGPTIRLNRSDRPLVEITGPERAILYRIALGTGFRAQEIRTLTPERFHLDGDAPSITVLACYSKRGKRSGRDDVQPIRRDLAALLKPWLATRPAGKPVLPMPPENAAKLLRKDLLAAGIDDGMASGAGVVDFHAIRHTFITNLVNSGVNPKHAQVLARHSTITLTLDRYTVADAKDVRGSLEGE